jgi:hypothetical protein
MVDETVKRVVKAMGPTNTWHSDPAKAAACLTKK